MTNPTNLWQCPSCEVKNYLRNTQCAKCGAPMPKKVKNQIFREELKTQLVLIEKETVQKHSERWTKFNKPLVNLKLFTKILMATAAVVFFGFILWKRDEIRDINIIADCKTSVLTVFDDLKSAYKTLKGGMSNVIENMLRGDQLLQLADKAKIIIHAPFRMINIFIEKLTGLFP